MKPIEAHLDGKHLTGLLLTERKQILAALLARLRADGPVRYSDSCPGPGPSVQGVVSKLAAAPYRFDPRR